MLLWAFKVLSWGFKQAKHDYPLSMLSDIHRAYCSRIVMVILLGVILPLLAGCASTGTGSRSTSLETKNQTPIDGYVPCAAIQRRTQPITCLVLHHTATPLPSALQTLQGKTNGHRVGIHYLVSDESKARVFRMAHECFATSHAGKSRWKDYNGLNQFSVGIEIVNLDGNTHPYPPSQVAAIIRLCQDIIRRNNISPVNVVAHSDIAIGRKVDPGSLFPWKQLAAAGVGAWPDDNDVTRCTQLYQKGMPSPTQIRAMLKSYGYVFDDNSDAFYRTTVEAFQRHFRGRKVDGIADIETVAILAALNFKYNGINPSLTTAPAIKK